MTGQYYYTICEPDNPKIIQMGDILKENILKIFDDFPWISYLRKMASMQEDAIHYSPSLEFGNRNNHTGIVFSIVGTEDEHEFYVFYKRPKTVQQSLGLFKHDMKEYISDIMDQSMEDARQILIAFVNDDTLYLEEKMKKQ